MPEHRHNGSSRLALQALVSIHDVMPETRPQVTDMLAQLGLPPESVTLLVVPGRTWSAADLKWLRDLQHAGHPLAGHGWFHRCQPPVTLYHKLHSALLSRRVAEHLSFSGDAIVQLVKDCHDWFDQHALTVSSLYVPPAWALGALTREQCGQLPFRHVETLSGLLDTASGDSLRLPLAGFEADTRLRALFLSWFNRVNVARARRHGVPLRIGLHPFDLSLRLAPGILQLIQQVDICCSYESLSVDAAARPSLSSTVRQKAPR